MATTYTCDICRKPTQRIKGKLNYIDLDVQRKNGKRQIGHSDYTHTADVGECCADRLLELFNFRPRQTRAEYMKRRRERAGRG